MKIVITYDVNKRNPEVKTELIKARFHDRLKKNNVLYFLPDTTLWHPDLPNASRAHQLFDGVITSLNENQPPDNIITVSHFMAFEYSISSGIPGEPHT